ncbi:MAG: hypothetical protein ACKOX6_07255 [Bdellovibrio sp.]
MFALFFSLALAATPPKTPVSLSEAASKINALLPEEDRIIVPSNGSRQFFSLLNEFKPAGSSAQTTKEVLKISDKSIQGCNAYSWGGGGELHLTAFNDAFKRATEQVSREGSLPKALQLARISLMAVQCKGPIIMNALAAEWLKSSMNLIKSLPHKKLKSDDKLRLHSLCEQIAGINSEKILKDSLRYEVVTAAALISAAIEDSKSVSWFANSEDIPSTQRTDFWQQFAADKSFPTDWSRDAKISLEIINAVSKSKAPSFTEYQSEISKQYEAGLNGLWKDLELSDLGFASAAELKNNKRIVDLVDRLSKDNAALKSLQKNMTEHPEVSSYIFQMALTTLKVEQDILKKFDSKIDEVQSVAKKIK